MSTQSNFFSKNKVFIIVLSLIVVFSLFSFVKSIISFILLVALVGVVLFNKKKIVSFLTRGKIQWNISNPIFMPFAAEWNAI